MRKLIFLTAAAGAFLIAGTAFSATAQAATLEEVIATAREYGHTEDEIQTALNKYEEDMAADPYAYDEHDMDIIIQQIKANGKKVIDTVPYNPDVTIPGLTTAASTAQDTVTTAAAEDTTESATSSAATGTSQASGSGNSTHGGNGNTQGGGNTQNGSGGNAQSGSLNVSASDEITLTMSDGTTFTRISIEQFIALSYEDKMLYLGTFTPEQQAVFIESLTPAERRTLMKQLPTDKKAEVVDGMNELASSFGLNLSVDEMTDDSLVIAMKDDEGKLVSISRAGDVVDDTGYDRRGILAIAAGLVIAGMAAIAAVGKKYFGRCADE